MIGYMEDMYKDGNKVVLFTNAQPDRNMRERKIFGRIFKSDYDTMIDAIALCEDTKEFSVFTIDNTGIIDGIVNSKQYLILRKSQGIILKSYINKMVVQDIMDECSILQRKHFKIREVYEKFEQDTEATYDIVTMHEIKTIFYFLMDGNREDKKNKLHSVPGKLTFNKELLLDEFERMKLIEYNILGCNIKEIHAMVRRFKMCTDIKKHIKEELKNVEGGTHLKLVKTLEILLHLAFTPELSNFKEESLC